MTQQPDPIFALIRRWRQARANFNAAVGAATDATYEDVAAAPGDAIREAELAIIRTPPRTLAGAVGVLAVRTLRARRRARRDLVQRS